MGATRSRCGLALRACRQILDAGENGQFLPGFPIPPAIAVTGERDAITAADILISAIPSEFLRPTLLRIRAHMRSGQFIVSATKGLEDRTLFRMTKVLSETLEPVGLLLPIGALSGPSFAQEVANGQPTALTVAFSDAEVAALIQQEFSSETLRLYTSTDVIGVELGGALKNVIAIAAGIAVGVGLGYNSTAALITRGIAEMTRLAVHAARGAKPSRDSPESAIWSSPAPARSAAIAPSASNSDRAASCPKFSHRSAAKWLRACIPRTPLSALPASTALKCPSPGKWSSSSTKAKTPAKPSAPSCSAPAKKSTERRLEALTSRRIGLLCGVGGNAIMG